MSSQDSWLARNSAPLRGVPSVRTRRPAMRPMKPRNSGGTSSRWPNSESSTWSGTRVRKPKATPIHRADSRRRDSSVLAVDADAVKLHPVVDQAIAELLGDLLLQ